MKAPDREQLVRIAVDAMSDKGFMPEPPAAAQAEADACAGTAPSKWRTRDLRKLPWTSIDNRNTRDLDQVEIVEQLAGGRMRLYVGIADVTMCVQPDTALDRYAAANTTSVYTLVRTFAMLPERLSFERTSLMAGEQRAVMVVETEIEADGTPGGAKAYPALIENHARLDYPSVAAWLDGKARPPAGLSDPALRQQVELQDQLASRLRETRKRAGALDVDRADIRVECDMDGRMMRLRPRVRDRAGALVEELMVATNCAVARVLDAAGLPAIRRVMRMPVQWPRLVEYAAARGFALPPAPDTRAVAAFLDEMRRTRPAEIAEIALSARKLLGRADYLVHTPGEADHGHFTLGTAAYCHATAPNRRYPDIIVQRLLHAAARGEPGPDAAMLTDVATHCSQMERQAQRVERRVHKAVGAAFLDGRFGETFDAVITGVTAHGTYVRILDPCAEGKLLDADAGLAVGDKVPARLVSVDVDKGYIDFRMAA